MSRSRFISLVAVAALLAGTLHSPKASAGSLDGLAGAAVGFALGAMVAGSRPAYGRPRMARRSAHAPRRARGHYAAGSSRRSSRPHAGATISAASDPFASSASPRPIPVSGR